MLKPWIKAAASSRFGWPLTARVLRADGVTVLMYHRIHSESVAFPAPGIEQFRAQMQWLRRRCTPIAPEQFIDALAGRFKRRPPVLVTFDDGYRDYHDHAYPVLQELRIPAVVFLATDFIDRGGLIWTDAVSWAVHASRCTTLNLPWNPAAVFDLTGSDRRDACVQVCKAYLKNIPDAERLMWQTRLFAALRVDPQRDTNSRQMLTWDEVRATLELTSYGGHSHTHPILSQLDADTAEQEIRLCRERIAAETGMTPRYFAYPNGRARDFNDQTQELLRRHGFELAFSTIEGIHTPGMDNYAIRRQPSGASTLGDFAWLVSGR